VDMIFLCDFLPFGGRLNERMRRLEGEIEELEKEARSRRSDDVVDDQPLLPSSTTSTKVKREGRRKRSVAPKRLISGKGKKDQSRGRR